MFDGITLDLTDYRDKSGSRVPEGTYTAVVGDIEVGKSQKGDQMITLFLDIAGDAAGTRTEFDGLTIVDRLTITKAALFRVVGFLQALGEQTPRQAIRINPSTWKGRRVLVDLIDGDPYRGRVKSEVAAYARAAKSSASSAPSEFEALAAAAQAPAPAPAPMLEK